MFYTALLIAFVLSAIGVSLHFQDRFVGSVIFNFFAALTVMFVWGVYFHIPSPWLFAGNEVFFHSILSMWLGLLTIGVYMGITTLAERYENIEAKLRALEENPPDNEASGKSKEE